METTYQRAKVEQTPPRDRGLLSHVKRPVPPAREGERRKHGISATLCGARDRVRSLYSQKANRCLIDLLVSRQCVLQTIRKQCVIQIWVAGLVRYAQIRK